MLNSKITFITALTIGTVAFGTETRAQQVASARAVQAGVAAAVRGNVTLVSYRNPEKVGRNIASGDEVYLGDRVESGPRAGLQIMLMDETIFTIGPDSAIVIDTFIYDPDKSVGKVSAKILRGAFRFVSGRVAANKPSDMQVRLPNGTIGIRGTSAGGFVRDGVSEVVLLGPGPDNNVGEPGGRIIVSGETGGSNVHITRVNFGTRITGATGPTGPVRWDSKKMNTLTGALRAAPPNRPTQTQPSGNNQARQGAAKAARVDFAGTATRQAGQDIGGAVVTAGLLQEVGGKQDGFVDKPGEQIDSIKDTLSKITTVNQLTQITSGTFNYGTTNNAMKFNGGVAASTYDFTYSIDFGNRTHAGSVTVNTNAADTGFATASGTFNLLHNPFSESGPLEGFEGGPTTHVPGLNGNDNRIKVEYKFVNDGDIATRIEHKVTYAEPQSAPTRTLTGSGKNTRPK